MERPLNNDDMGISFLAKDDLSRYHSLIIDTKSEMGLLGGRYAYRENKM